MEPRPPGCVAGAAAALLLLLWCAQGQASTPGPPCDCPSGPQRRYSPLCCRGCPVGHYMKAPCTEPCGDATCLPCPPGTFLATGDHAKTRCTRCQSCDEEASQVALKNCSAAADTQCGCEPGWFRDCSAKPCWESSPFHCLPCTDCEALHRHVQLPCSSGDTECGPCLPGFYERGEHGDGCLSCPTSFFRSCPEHCAAVCGWRQMLWIQVLVACLVLPLLPGAVLIYRHHYCQPPKPVASAEPAGTEALTSPQDTRLSPSDSACTLLVPPGDSRRACTDLLVANSCWIPGFPQTQDAAGPQVPQPLDHRPRRALGAPAPEPAPPAGSPLALLQPGPQLYDVVDAVPARRWKEFVRTLGLREAEIEAVEVEICRFRDQQYEMLKRWRQQQPAVLGAIYAALERMGLGGCAEDLRARLQRGWDPPAAAPR
ncbi:LOW QUALITY PROTEIN: tumor necrosis factor receptor superfamily member 25 [Perognathus longimembris pacificus]|uniref:LOW QUALITY PROTEIN: tumor necrosis factor receptor superfamily member 25 n=1 Tax=Perognathus longimembris pacificus TaxID=214514 RepID=UPI002019DA48|nr:LOW QUALITY PROTEIN: tumor necrosis factor receptor superfamily member 25 [Perognathus longimembris pacificus]